MYSAGFLPFRPTSAGGFPGQRSTTIGSAANTGMVTNERTSSETARTIRCTAVVSLFKVGGAMWILARIRRDFKNASFVLLAERELTFYGNTCILAVLAASGSEQQRLWEGTTRDGLVGHRHPGRPRA